MGFRKRKNKRKLRGNIPGTGGKRSKRGRKNNALAANNVPATTFPRWKDLPKELRLIVRAFACNYELGQDRIIEARLNILWRPDPTPDAQHLYVFLDSPPGPYTAPIRTVWQGGYVMFANRFPNLLMLGNPSQRRIPGEVGIEFNASRDIIFMDARSLFLLSHAHATGYNLQGFDRIINLATPMANNNIEGLVHDLRGDDTLPLPAVVDPIRLITDVPNSINDSVGFAQYARGILGNNYGGAGTDEAVADFFGPPY